MLSELSKGTQFYYADRKQGRPVKCKIVDVDYSFPTEIVAENIETKQIVVCYNAFGCYNFNEYENALKDAQIQEDRIIY